MQNVTTIKKSNKASKWLLVSIFGVLAIAVTGIIVYGAYQYKQFLDFGYKFLSSKTKVNKLGINNTDITVFVELQNKSSIAATVSGYDLDVYANNTKISNVLSNTPFLIQPKGTSIIEVRIVFNPMQVLKLAVANMGDILNGGKNINIEIKGDILNLKSGILSVKNIPVEYSTTLKELTSTTTTTVTTT